MFNPKQVRDDFPIYYHNPDLVYLDSSATSLKPISVINKLTDYYKKYSANIHRGIYQLAEKASEEYEETRKILSLFINSKIPEEIIFTKGTTESLNLIAASLGSDILQEGDEIVTTIMEHHANFVPWQQLVERNGAILKVIGINDQHELGIVTYNYAGKAIIDFEEIITNRTKILALTYVSNTLGTINPVKEIIKAAKKKNPQIITVVDAAQAIPHYEIDVRDLDCDFLVFSGHKMLGPTGVGVLWGKKKLLESMRPYQFGGDMIREVKLEQTTFADVPHKFEAGTPPIAEVIALKESVAYLNYYGFEDIRKHETSLVTTAVSQLQDEFGELIHILGPQNPKNRAGIVTFTLNGIHPHDIAQVLDESQVCVRAGHHCTMPLHDSLGLAATVRVSFYLYNTKDDIDKLITGLKRAVSLLKKNI